MLLNYYLSGHLRCEINILYPATNYYYRNIYFLYEDETSGHIMAYSVGRVISSVENEVFSATGDIKNKIQEENESFYKNLMDIQSCGVFAYTMPGYQIVTINADALRMFGCETVDDVQKNIKETVGSIHYTSNEAFEKLKKLRTEDASVDYECIFNKGKENEFYVIPDVFA